MENFTEAYEKLRDVVFMQVFETDWQTFLASEANVKRLLGADGPAPPHATALDKLRNRIAAEDRARRSAAVLDACKPGSLAVAGAAARGALAFLPAATVATRVVNAYGGDGAAVGAEVMSAGAKGGAGTVAERAAALKMLWHLYRAAKRGGQDVWVYAPPQSYTTWVFDEIKGSDDQIKAKLDKTDEVYSAADRDVMCTALAQAMKWSLDAVTKLATPTDATKAVVRAWFADQDTTDAQLDTAVTKLKEGFKKIAAVCNSNTLIFSDDPLDRVKVYDSSVGKVGWDDWAFVKPWERMDIVYLQNAFLKFGATGKTWKCALTIVHEISHRAVGTQDNMYDSAGLKPDKSKFPSASALGNADSWGYFATDLAGFLAPSDRTTVLKTAA